jgi:flagellar basal-body rod protein FlgB
MKIQDTAKTREEIRSHLPAIENTNIRVAEDRTISQRLDGNNVDMDGESIELAKAQLQYMYLTNSMTNMYARLKTALSSNN